jgi:hypothetical protein
MKMQLFANRLKYLLCTWMSSCPDIAPATSMAGYLTENFGGPRIRFLTTDAHF